MNKTNDFKKIVTQNIPLIDVRSPIEYEKGAFFNSINLPLMNDEERHLVGICYKEKGNEEALKLGHHLVSGKKRRERIEAWGSHIKKHPNSMIYCLRGGSRSRISQEWLHNELGIYITRLDGGYKAFRNYLIKALEPREQTSIPVLLGGYTGSGKTLLLKKIENSIDLEGLANHRGSSFGKNLTAQPSQITFENNLAYSIIQNREKGYCFNILEDESSNIGRNVIPKPLFEYFRSGNLVILEIPFEKRLQITLDEYVTKSQLDYTIHFGEEEGFIEWYKYISNSILRIKKRLGGDCFSRVMKELEISYDSQLRNGNKNSHNKWLEILLKEYYDPMYNYQMNKNKNHIIFKGNEKEVMEFLKTLSGKNI